MRAGGRFSRLGSPCPLVFLSTEDSPTSNLVSVTSKVSRVGKGNPGEGCGTGDARQAYPVAAPVQRAVHRRQVNPKWSALRWTSEEDSSLLQMMESMGGLSLKRRQFEVNTGLGTKRSACAVERHWHWLSTQAMYNLTSDASSLVVSEAEGYKLKISQKSKTGYKNIVPVTARSFTVQFHLHPGDTTQFRGRGFTTAVDAAIWYAKYTAGEDPALPNGFKCRPAGQSQPDGALPTGLTLIPLQEGNSSISGAADAPLPVEGLINMETGDGQMWDVAEFGRVLQAAVA